MIRAVNPPLDQQVQYYSQRWAELTYANRIDVARMAAILDLIAHTEAPYPPKICDLGCGVGWTTAMLGAHGPTTGVDLTDLSAARQRYPDCEFLTANAPEWDAPEAVFDFVVAQEVLEHIERPHQPKFLSIAHKLLKPGGWLILTTPNRKTFDAIPGGGRTYSNQPVEDWVDVRELRGLLSSAGFEIQFVSSIILGMGRRGIYRLVNSGKLIRLFEVLGARQLWEWAAGRAGFGLHLIIQGRKAE